MFYIFIAWKILQWFFYVIFPILAKLEIDQLVEKNEQLFWFITLSSFNIFLIILILIFAIQFIETLIKWFLELFEYDYIKLYDNYLSKSLYKRLENASAWFFLNSRNKRFMDDILSNSSKIGDWVRSFIGDLISYSFVIIWVLTVLALINAWTLVVLWISTLIVFYIEKRRKAFEEKVNFNEHYDNQEKIWILTSEMWRNFSKLIMSWGFPIVMQAFSNTNKAIQKDAKSLQKRNLRLWLFSFIIENISELLIKLIIGWWVFIGTTSIGTMTLTLMYSSRIKELLNFIKNFSFLKNNFIDDLLKLNLFLEITDYKEESFIQPKDFRDIEFKNVSFSYPNFAKYESKYLDIIENRIKSYNPKDIDEYQANELHLISQTRKELETKNPMILSKVNILFQTGKLYGIIGKNGAWKTTLISLIQNFFNNYDGEILMGEHEISTIKKSYILDNIAVITQSPYIIDWLSIKENLLMWVSKKFSDTHIYEILETFWLRKKIEKNRLWLNSKIGYENDFSWWEKQILALIRVILQNKKIIIMDEGTNQLDAENEAQIIKKLLLNKKDKIIIFISHRMTSIKKADVIYCIHNWKIQDQWNHAELLQKDSIYKKFWFQQVEN